jgi:hypothetical protein
MIEQTFYSRLIMLIDLILNIGCAFDWITPTAAFVQDIYHGPVYDFAIPANAGWSRSNVKRFLTQHGVQVWGLMYTLNGKELMFTVPHEQAEYAYYLLQNAGNLFLDDIEEYIYSPT